MQQRLKCWIGNGVNVEIWKDNWLPGVMVPPVPSSSNTLDQTARVSQLIEWDGGGWNQALIRQSFDEQTANIILSVPFSHRLCADKLVWSNHSTRNYTAKTGYHLAVEVVNGNGGEAGLPNEVSVGIWKWLWGLQLPHKIKLFGWKCCRSILPTNLALAGKIPNTKTQVSKD
ncbi:hypothetical protein CFOL_v3_10934 [Cephalotus follicularis]|uniref:Zf-RVT domain-containing protein n=1 Tax=Cephalotus follicularis TaxID=3775 RepID=A0A1Q3BHM7_CEPFO|nr:hypothetical protein CFOL_v3_10934 [Cephalotus follicularis]